MATEPLLKSLRENTRRIIEVVITGERAKKTQCVVFVKRVTKITRNEAKLLGAHFDYIFGRARVLKTGWLCH